MAGSLKWFEYETDGAVTFAIFMDESNGEAIANPDYTAASTAVFELPRNITPRKVRYTSADNLYQRSIPVCTAGESAGTLPATISINVTGAVEPITLTLADFTGEKFRAIPRAADTGLTDGDAT